MAIERVREYFRDFDMEDRIQEFDVSSATVELAAEALHCEPCRIAKTLSFMVEEKPILIVTAGDVKIDNAKFKAKFKTKAKMLAYEEVEACIGHAVAVLVNMNDYFVCNNLMGNIINPLLGEEKQNLPNLYVILHLIIDVLCILLSMISISSLVQIRNWNKKKRK